MRKSGRKGCSWTYTQTSDSGPISNTLKKSKISFLLCRRARFVFTTGKISSMALPCTASSRLFLYRPKLKAATVPSKAPLLSTRRQGLSCNHQWSMAMAWEWLVVRPPFQRPLTFSTVSVGLGSASRHAVRYECKWSISGSTFTEFNHTRRRGTAQALWKQSECQLQSE